MTAIQERIPPLVEKLELEILGDPVPWNRPFRTAKGQTFVGDKQVQRVNEIRQAWADAGRTTFPKGVPLQLTLVVFCSRPDGHYGTGRNATRLRDSAPKRPCGRPDLSNCLKLVEDALALHAFPDDDQVVGYDHVAKHYAGHGENPRTIVRVREAPGG